MTLDTPPLRPPTQIFPPLIPIVQKNNATNLISTVEQSSSSSLTDVNLTEVMEEMNRPRELDNSDIKRQNMRELSNPDLATVENPDTFYSSIKSYMDTKIDAGDTSFTTTKMINQLNQLIDSRMSKILMTCFRHYNNERLLEEQKAFMTPQELEMASRVIDTIKTFREFIYH